MAQRPPEIPSEAIAPRGRGSSYLAIWATLACLSAVYLAAVSIRPAFLHGILPATQTEVAAQHAAELTAMRDDLGKVRTDVDKVQVDLTSQAEHTRSLSDRIAALEQNRPADAQAQAPAPAGQDGSHQQHGAAQQPASGNDFPETGHSSTARPTVINPPLETGSVQHDIEAAPPRAKAAPAEKAPAEKAAAAPAKPKKPVGIRLATGGSVDNLRVSWGVLSERHSEELKSLQPRYFNSVDGNGITYELVAGPFKTTADAKKVCQSLKAQAIDCQVSNYGGNAL